MGIKRGVGAAVCAVVVLLGGTVVAAQESPTSPPSPEEYAFGGALGPEDGEFPAGAEVVEARTETTRTYETGVPGVFATEVSNTPVNFQQNGDWVPIDPSLVETEDGYQNAASRVQIDLADSADDETVAQLTLPSSASVGFAIDDAEASEVAVDGTTATYEDVVEGADVELESLPTGLKETIVLDSASAPSAYSFPLSLAGVTAQLNESGGVDFVDGNGHVKFVIPPGYMEDSSSDDVGNPAASDTVSYTLVDGGQTLEVSLDQEWLNDPTRVFPVLVDPTVYVYSEADDTFVADVGSTDRSGYYVLKAGYDGTYKYRSFLHFDMSQFDDMNVLAATLRVAQTGSGSCTPSPLDVFEFAEDWEGNTTTSWPGPEIYEEPLGTISSGAGHDGSCGWAFATTDMTRLAQYWSEGEENNGISLRARDENSTSQWKEVGSQESYNAPRIEVLWGDPTATSAPDNPTDLLPIEEETLDSTPTFSGTYSDPQNDDGEIVFFGYDGATGAFLAGYPSSVVDSGNTAIYTSGELPIDYNIIWRAMAVDTVHNVGSELSSESTIRRPSIYITAPAAWTEQTSDFTVSASLDAGVSGATGVQFLLDGSPLTTDNSAPYSTAVTLAGLGFDIHELTAKIVGGTWNGVVSSAATIGTDDGSDPSGDEEDSNLFIDSAGIVVGPADADNASEAIEALADGEEDPGIVTVVIDMDHPENGWQEIWSTGAIFEENGDPVDATYEDTLSSGEQAAAAATLVESPGSGPYILDDEDLERYAACSADPKKPWLTPTGGQDPRVAHSQTLVQCDGQVYRTRAFNSLWRIRSDGEYILRDRTDHAQDGDVAITTTSEGCESRGLNYWRGKGMGIARGFQDDLYPTDFYWSDFAHKHCYG